MMAREVAVILCLCVALPALLATAPIGYGYGPVLYADQYGQPHGSHGHNYADNSHIHGGQLYNNHGLKNHHSTHGDTSHGSDYYKGHGNQYKGYGNKNSDVHHHNSANVADKNYHDHQNVNDGFHNVYHKEEYAKNNKYFDKNGSFLNKASHNNHANHYDDVNGQVYNDYNKGSGGARGHQDYGHNSNHGQYNNNGENYGKNLYGGNHQGYGHDYGYYGTKK